MITREELGRRLRETRTQRGMTLKQLDEASGFSATHISEIERGKTSPTIGALLRIAGALGKSASYFIESEPLPEIAHVPADRRIRVEVGKVHGEVLSLGIPGGRIYAAIFRLEPGGPALEIPKGIGEECGYVVRGEVDLSLGPDSWRLRPGSAVHHAAEHPAVFRAAGSETAEIILLGPCQMAQGEPVLLPDSRRLDRVPPPEAGE